MTIINPDPSTYTYTNAGCSFSKSAMTNSSINTWTSAPPLTSFSLVGTHKVCCTIQVFKNNNNGKFEPAECFNLVIGNTPPTFVSALSPTIFSMYVNATSATTLVHPDTYDAEGHIVTVTLDQAPGFVSYIGTAKTLSFWPKATGDIGTKTFQVCLFDGGAYTNTTITINVLNHPPKYNVTPAPIYLPMTVALNSVKIISVPSFYDEDRSDSTVYINEVSKTIATVNLASTVPSNSVIMIAPVGFGEVGVHTVQVVLWDYSADNSGKNPSASFDITVTNSAPKFSIPDLPNVTCQMNFVNLQTITQIQDDEGHTAYFTIYEVLSTGVETSTIPYVSL